MHSTWNWKSQLRYLALFIPVTAYFLLFALVLFGLYYVAFQMDHAFDSITLEIIRKIVQAIFFLTLLLLVFCLLTTLLPYLWLQFQKLRGKMRIEIGNSPAEEETRGRKIFLRVYPLLRPVLGFVYFRVLYDNRAQSPRLALAEGRQTDGQKWGFKEGYFIWPLQGIREYPVNELIIYFEDIFHFFSLAARIEVHQRFHIVPQILEEKPDAGMMPLRIRDPETRTDDLRRTEGELLSFKNFEPNDDVRRIVWKLYARNKELMVRKPEIQDPTASIINLFFSFYDHLDVENNYILNVEALNYYKNACWTLERQLIAQGRQIRIFYDQAIPQKITQSQAEADAYALSACQWQKENTMGNLDIPLSGTMVVISSLASPEALTDFLQELPASSTILFVRLSQVIPKPDFSKILKRIFIMPENKFEKQGYSDLRVRNTRLLLMENEAYIEEVLKTGINKYFLA